MANPFEIWTGGPPADFGLPAGLVNALVAGCRAVQIVGGSGLGKTTHLLALQRWATASGQPAAYHRLDPQQPPPAPPRSGWWLLDETQLLPDRTVRGLLAQARSAGLGLACATHRRHWFLAGVVTWRLPGLGDAAALASLLGSYLLRAGQPHRTPWDPAVLRQWRQLSAGNVELTIRLAYELWEDRGSLDQLTAAELHAAAGRLQAEAPDLWALRRNR
ncbi:MAG: hypothetical protein IT204_05195 [Fimbriimonadaceae bacterium]|nr:hypothetical protein [Fimbriimonadaceae bacterium]